MTTSLTTKVTFEGPFFDTDIHKTYVDNVHTMLEGFAAEGEAAARSAIGSGPPHRPVSATGGRVADYVHGRVAAIAGNEWKWHAVISPSNAGLSASQAISLYAAASELESSTRAFRGVSSALRSSRAVNVAELTKGMGD